MRAHASPPLNELGFESWSCQGTPCVFGRCVVFFHTLVRKVNEGDWIGKQFEMTLLLQSVVMILTMFAMLHLCCTVHNTNRVSTRQHRLSDLNFQYFWKWSAFEDYLLFCFGFTVLCAVVTLLLLDSAVFVETLGSLALMFEAMLGLPQLLQNFDNRSTKGMSVKMVLLWTAGDVFKTTYFVMNESPAQFWVCGSVQIMIDVSILLQVLLYNQDSRVKLG
uniref:Uncharacterized protein n=1 Tax=Amphiprion ocellaris TaxID=80972 RepID=A0A3Q1ATU7_AMPOC